MAGNLAVQHRKVPVSAHFSLWKRGQGEMEDLTTARNAAGTGREREQDRDRYMHRERENGTCCNKPGRRFPGEHVSRENFPHPLLRVGMSVLRLSENCEDLSADEIASIRWQLDAEPVFNIEVECCHTYFVDGVILHNKIM